MAHLIESPACARYALYWVPDREHPLWQAGCAWLGRDPQSAVPGAAPTFARQPWRYGFHATIKAPMPLRPQLGEADFIGQARAWAAAQQPFALPTLAVAALKDFIALRPIEAVDAAHPLRRMADSCVVTLDACRQPLAVVLEDAHLLRWGYRYVFDRWRFHMTLSDQGTGHDEELLDLARRRFHDALRVPARVDAVAVFREPARGEPFQWLARLPFASAT